jgi:hypothetical protein
MRDDLPVGALDQRLIVAKFDILSNVVEKQIHRRLLRGEGICRPVKNDLR